MRTESASVLYQSFRCFQNSDPFFFLAEEKFLLQTVVTEPSPGLNCCITYSGTM